VAHVNGRGVQIPGGTLPLSQCFLLASLMLCIFAFSLSGFCFAFASTCDFSAIYLIHEDRWLLLVETALLFLASRGLVGRVRPLALPSFAVPLVALGIAVLCYAGTRWLLFDYAYSRDEQMAVFDSEIFRAGHLVQPLPLFWQAHTKALNTLFLLPVVHPAAWVSAYLPMNAAMRALAGFVGDAALTGPLMVAVGLVALWRCARLLWPDDREAAVVAVLLYLGSGQVWFAGMTAYAMPAHLTLDLLWLWCFLLNRRAADCAALLVAFVATGLHQPLFHLLFAAPILFTLVRDRNWRRVGLYAIGYAAISAFWLAWPVWMHALVTGPHSVTAATGTDYFTRFVQTVSRPQPMRWEQMAANLLRFVAWQHVLLMPLMMSGIAPAWRERFAAAFAVTVVLPVFAMLAILPFQGNGFGYRYMHGVLGSTILLAVYGWRKLVAEHVWLRPLAIRTSAAGLVVLLPLQGWLAWSMYRPFAQIDQRINASRADYFIIGADDALLGFNLVVNRPDLSNRPIRLLAAEANDDLVRGICKPGARVAMPTSEFLRPIESYFAMPHSTAADIRITNLSPRLTAAGCTVDRLGAIAGGPGRK
jgi:hypothetical protein